MNLTPAEMEILEMVEYLCEEDMKQHEPNAPARDQKYWETQITLRSLLKIGPLCLRDNDLVPEYGIEVWLSTEEGTLLFA